MRNHLWWEVYRDQEWIGGCPTRSRAREMRDESKQATPKAKYRIEATAWDWVGAPAIPRKASIDTAWARMEDAMPYGWQLIRLRWRRQGHWSALALKTDGMVKHVLSPARTGIGPSAADALNSLADQLEKMEPKRSNA